jgi:hypothetical protein
MNDLFSGFIGSLLGGLLALAGTWWAGQIQRRQAREAAERAERELISGFLGAIEAELSVLAERYTARLRPALASVPDGGIFNFAWPIRHDYFTVYVANAGLLGRLPDEELRTLIVRTYTFARGMLDSLALNSEMVTRLEILEADQALEPQVRAAKVKFLVETLAEYARAIKISDAELATHFDQALAGLRAPHQGNRQLVA